MSTEVLGVDYLSIQITVAFAMIFAGIFSYTMGMFFRKQGIVEDLNNFLTTLDIGIFIEKLKFDNKFWKTAGVAAAISIVITLLVYSEAIAQVDPNEALIVTAAKFYALGLAMNFTINTAASGGQLSKLIQAIILALSTQEGTTTETNLLKAKRLLEKQNLVVKIDSNKMGVNSGNNNNSGVVKND